MTDPSEPFGHRTVTAADVARFGEITGDDSHIHVDHVFGQNAPGGRGIAHGLLGASWALGALTRHAPGRLGRRNPGAFPAAMEVRFEDVVRFDDTLAFRCEPAPAESTATACRTAFTVHEGTGRAPARGAVVCEQGPPDAARSAEFGAVEPWSEPATVAPAPTQPMGAQAVLDFGPRGASPVRTLTESDVVGFCNFTGELNSLYLDAAFAKRALFGARIAPPMLCFCLGFATWLSELLKLPLAGSANSAGHLGDRWRFVAPVAIGDTLAVRYRPLRLDMMLAMGDAGEESDAGHG